MLKKDQCSCMAIVPVCLALVLAACWAGPVNYLSPCYTKTKYRTIGLLVTRVANPSCLTGEPRPPIDLVTDYAGFLGLGATWFPPKDETRSKKISPMVAQGV